MESQVLFSVWDALLIGSTRIAGGYLYVKPYI